MTERPLTSEERQVWQNVSRTVSPRRKGSARPEPGHDAFLHMMRIPPVTQTNLVTAQSDLQINQDRKTRRGRVIVDAKLDLHDKTQTEAWPLLLLRVKRSAQRGHKCLLVITGKGVRLDGVLRRAFPNWINSPDIRPFIASYAPAHIRHGGSGAWYVFFKSQNSKI